MDQRDSPKAEQGLKSLAEIQRRLQSIHERTPTIPSGPALGGGLIAIPNNTHSAEHAVRSGGARESVDLRRRIRIGSTVAGAFLGLNASAMIPILSGGSLAHHWLFLATAALFGSLIGCNLVDRRLNLRDAERAQYGVACELLWSSLFGKLQRTGAKSKADSCRKLTQLARMLDS